MNAIESVKKGFEAAKNLVPLMVVVGIFNLVSGGIMLAILGAAPSPEKIADVSAGVGVVLFLVSLCWIFLEGGVFSAMVSTIKTGEFDSENFISDCASFFLRLLGLSLLSILIAGGILLFGLFISGIFLSIGGGNNPFFGVIGMIFMFITIILFFLVLMPLAFGQYMMIIKDGKIVATIKDSFAVFKKYWGRIVLMLALLMLIFIGLILALNLISWILGKLIPVGLIFGIINVVFRSSVNAFGTIFIGCTMLIMLLSLITNQDNPDNSKPQVEKKLESFGDIDTEIE
ncbi:MAG: hypothetical protein DRP78_05615 [Candidatus Omnitrophota bacterium]|nr:MAG: hypothetical protein DRP78_05615 [Candidatus Omnitrophota bacterium]